MKNLARIVAVCILCLVFLPSNGQRPTGWCKTKFVDSAILKEPININSFSSRLISTDGIILIPVVVHILYNVNQPAENISEQLIYSQIERLNKDLRKMNTEVAPYGPWVNLQSDSKFEFRLACVDPQGNYTNGIVRKPTSVNQFLISRDLKFNISGGDNAWPTNKYLNIWIGDLDDPSDFLGEAQYPENYNTTNGGIPGFLTDGIVLDYTIVGDVNGHAYNDMGRVAVHEVGHWLGLTHVFSAIVCANIQPDIPPQYGSFYRQCPSFPVLNDGCIDFFPGVMFMNYMNYTDDECRYMFTPAQSSHMRSYFSIVGNPIRFPFIDNYFGIVAMQNSTICDIFTVRLSNPMCLPVTYTFSGPVMELYHNVSLRPTTPLMHYES